MLWLIIMTFAIMNVLFTVVCVYPKKHNKESSKKMNSDIAWNFLIGDINKLNGKEDK